jgi:hypothetical protein
MTGLGKGLGRSFGCSGLLWLLALGGCATREVPTRHAQSSALSGDAAAGSPLAVTRALDPEASFDTHGDPATPDASPSATSAQPHSPHAGHAHGH